jgi:uncharacterized protein (DUF1778 family)
MGLATYGFCTYISFMKTERVEVRVTPEQKELLQKAAELEGLSVSQFMLMLALPRARQNIVDNAVERNKDSGHWEKSLAKLLFIDNNKPLPEETIEIINRTKNKYNLSNAYEPKNNAA